MNSAIINAELEWSILQTIAYADIFSYPLTLDEIHHYLIGSEATKQQVQDTLNGNNNITKIDEFYALPNREHTVEIRQRRQQIAADFWPIALKYGRLIGSLPFVRMVAVTGSLAVDNTENNNDIDYLIVTEPGRLWVCRLFIVALVRYVQRQGYTLCPNYIISENALVFPQKSLFAAREIAQMIPIIGQATYEKMRNANHWMMEYLPNAKGLPPTQITINKSQPPVLTRTAETLLRTPPGCWLDTWEMKRKIRKFMTHYDNTVEAAFDKDWCKGHFDGHYQRIMDEYETRLEALRESQRIAL